MILPCHPDNPEKRTIQRIVDGLQREEIFIVPTDTVYAFICSIDSPRSIAELYRLKEIPESQPLSLLCRDVAMASHYAKTIPNYAFRFIKAHTPGPYTFILGANREMDRRGTGKRKEVGIRIVDHPLHRAIMELVDSPLVSTSIINPDEFATDAEYLDQHFGHRIAAVVEGGSRHHDLSTILDCTGKSFVLARQGVGNIDELELAEE
ncbi:MAG: threonylcarbamoyl-AMP synthase [Leptospiraceae bacterium]|nr:threonylcarbamoyl-AMP synthase [Leptospiraceae bacterium]